MCNDTSSNDKIELCAITEPCSQTEQGNISSESTYVVNNSVYNASCNEIVSNSSCNVIVNDLIVSENTLLCNSVPVDINKLANNTMVLAKSNTNVDVSVCSLKSISSVINDTVSINSLNMSYVVYSNINQVNYVYDKIIDITKANFANDKCICTKLPCDCNQSYIVCKTCHNCPCVCHIKCLLCNYRNCIYQNFMLCSAALIGTNNCNWVSCIKLNSAVTPQSILNSLNGSQPSNDIILSADNHNYSPSAGFSNICALSLNSQ